MKVWGNYLATSMASDTWFDATSTRISSPRLGFGQGCFAPRQTVSFQGDLELTWSAAATPRGFLLHGGCQAGPMGLANAFVLVGSRLFPAPIQMGDPRCLLYLDPSSLLIFGPQPLDHLGNATWPAASPIAFVPADPAFTGIHLYGQWAAISNDWWDMTVYMSNGVKLQVPQAWPAGQGPAVTTVYAQGAAALTATTGTVQRNYGLIITVSP